MTRVAEGSRAPDFEYTTPEGARARLSELWADGPALVIWMRQCG